MQWHSTAHSSNIQKFAYNHDAQELHVKFKHGGEYIYTGVDPEHYDNLRGHQSPGSYIHEHFVRTKRDFRRP